MTFSQKIVAGWRRLFRQNDLGSRALVCIEKKSSSSLIKEASAREVNDLHIKVITLKKKKSVMRAKDTFAQVYTIGSSFFDENQY